MGGKGFQREGEKGRGDRGQGEGLSICPRVCGAADGSGGQLRRGRGWPARIFYRSTERGEKTGERGKDLQKGDFSKP